MLCPGREADPQLPPHLAELRRQLALHTRRLIDSGAFTPPPAEQPQPAAADGRPLRPVVQILGIRYLARHPVQDIHCVSHTRRRTRCRHPVLAPTGPAGTWLLQPATAVVAPRQLALPDTLMALYDLTPLPYTEQLRWRTQRCPDHTATPGAADLALADWQVFDPLVHHQHIRTQLPAVPRTPGAAGSMNAS